MMNSGSGGRDGEESAVGSMRALWGRAPVWRFFVLTAALLTIVFVLFPPDTPHDRNPALPANDSVATYVPPPAPRQVEPPEPATKPQTATLSMVTAHTPTSPGVPEGKSTDDSGLDPAMLGPTGGPTSGRSSSRRSIGRRRAESNNTRATCRPDLPQ